MKDFYSFARTSMGFSHISSGKPCQDYSIKFENNIASVIVVSDGHGSANFTRSDRGSRFACEVAVEAVMDFLRDLEISHMQDEFLRDAIVTQLCKYILLKWNSRVEEDASNDPFTEDEVAQVADKYKAEYLEGKEVEHAYGCTLIVVVMTRDFCLAIRNGDGQCVAVDCNGGFTTPIPWNDSCEFNVTTSLCDHEAIENFRYFYSTNIPAAIFISSDGVDDSYTSVEELYHLYRNICLKALRDGVEVTAEYVDMLLPEITRRGSTDDVSIAGIIHTPALQLAKTEMEHAIVLRQAELEKKRREHRKRILIRDIKVAEKKKARAVAQRQEILRKLRTVQERQEDFLTYIPIFRPRADDYKEILISLVQEEKQLTETINGADSDIARLNSELLALEKETEAAAVPDSGAQLASEPDEKAVQRIESLSDCAESAAERETEDTPAEQSGEEAPDKQEAPADPE